MAKNGEKEGVFVEEIGEKWMGLKWKRVTVEEGHTKFWKKGSGADYENTQRD